MKFFVILTYRTLLSVFLALGSVAMVQAQILTPGAAAIGGVTTDAQLIAPGGQAVPGTLPATTTQTGVETRSTIHLPDPTWPIILPPRRGNRGGPVQVAAATTPVSNANTQPANTAVQTGSTSNPSNVDTSAAVSATVADLAAQTPTTSTQTSLAADAVNATTQVTAGATLDTSPSFDQDNFQVVDETALDPLLTFDRAELNFGSNGVDITAQHEIALDPVVALMKANPLEPLRVVAVLALTESSSEEAKLLARRRILGVRRYLIEQGLSADNLAFLISANVTTEAFANHVLIERDEG